MRKIVVAGIAMALLMAAGRSAWAIQWERDLEVAFIKAKADNKPVMVDFSTEWCGWWKKLDAEVYTDADVNKLAESFVSVKVDCGKDKQAAARYGLRGYPTIIFFDPQGVQAETIVGYRDAGTFAGIMDKVLVAMAPKPAVAEEKPAVVARAEKVDVTCMKSRCRSTITSNRETATL